MSEKISITNSGVLNSNNIGGSDNRIVQQSVSGDAVDRTALCADIDRVLQHASSLPLDDTGRRDLVVVGEARRDVERGDISSARRRLASVGAWVSAMTAALSANVLKDFLMPR